ncbi:MAG: hypothetical protein K2W85_06535 [Phycisphaerales bacterium]|nr:hypothetical protein [Phycisphaerales bacterium]
MKCIRRAKRACNNAYGPATQGLRANASRVIASFSTVGRCVLAANSGKIDSTARDNRTAVGEADANMEGLRALGCQPGQVGS